MPWIHDPKTNTLKCTADDPMPVVYAVKQVELTDECIERLAEAIARKFKDDKDN